MAGSKDRITVVETIYHRRWGKDPYSVDSRFSRELFTSEQPYKRHLIATQEWQHIDCGWLQQIGMLVITNDEGRFLQVNPTGAERKAISQRVLEVGYGSEMGWLVPPGESMRGYPTRAEKLRVRCLSGSAEFTVHLFPE